MIFAQLLFATLFSIAWPAASAQEPVKYGVDCSFPIHSKELRCGDILGDRKKVYEDFMQGCRDYYKDKADRCDVTEDERIEMSIRQPQSMVNYTSTGFKKIKAPDSLFKLIKEHWEKNKDRKKQEVWPVGNIYVNHWEAPTFMVSVEDPDLPVEQQQDLKNAIWDAAKGTIEAWTGQKTKPVSMYGIRIYTRGAILSPHVDRLPLVSSCIVNVAQDVEEDWPLEVIDREGNSVNVTMEPGDMVLYESGSLIHHRTFALKGNYYANIFIHFEPIGDPLPGSAVPSKAGEFDDFYPPYLLPNSPWLEKWKQRNPYGWKKPAPSAAQVDTQAIHYAALHGDIDRLTHLITEDKGLVNVLDRNGWTCLHEAVRAGQTEAVKILIQNGADINARTHYGTGESVLAVAINNLPKDHPLINYLVVAGAHFIVPEDEL